jgi:hypothetical protein
VRPSVALHVGGVFLAFIALAHIGFHSDEAVKALFLTGIGAMATTVPGILTRIEYRLDPKGVSKRPVKAKEPQEFKELFSWEELDSLLPTRSGFKFYKTMRATNPLRRFLRRHILTGFSGEIHVEPSDRPRVRSLLEKHGAPFSQLEATREEKLGTGD